MIDECLEAYIKSTFFCSVRSHSTEQRVLPMQYARAGFFRLRQRVRADECPLAVLEQSMRSKMETFTWLRASF